jgi:hypothetical protein
MAKLLRDNTGIYNLDQVVSIHPLVIRGNKTDQTIITAVNTGISTVGGQTHHTNIPWTAASAIVLDYWKATVSAGAPPDVTPPANTAIPVVTPPVAVPPVNTGVPVVSPPPVVTPANPPFVPPPPATATELSADEAQYSA